MDGATTRYDEEASALIKIKNVIPTAGRDENNLPYI